MAKPKRGRPPIDRSHMLAEVEELASLGLNDQQIAAGMDCHYRTLEKLRDRDPAFAEAYQRGRFKAQKDLAELIKRKSATREGAADRIFAAKNILSWTDRHGLDVAGTVKLEVQVTYLHGDAPPQPIDVTPERGKLPEPGT